MSVSHGLAASETSPTRDAANARPAVTWPLAAAVIGSLSVGLWVLIFRVCKLLLAP